MSSPQTTSIPGTGTVNDDLPDALVELDITTGMVTHLNNVATLVFGYTADDVAAGLPASSLLSPRERALVAERIAADRASCLALGQPYQRGDMLELFELAMVRRGGSIFEAEIRSVYILDDRGVPAGLRIIVRDVSALRSARAIKSFGTVSGDIAHAMNNVLTVILGSTNLLSALVAERSEAEHEALTLIEEAVMRGMQITQHLQDLAHNTSFEVETVDVAALLHEVTQRLAELSGGRCVARLALPRELLHVWGDRAQLVFALADLAARFAEAGSTEVTVSPGAGAAGTWVEIRIEGNRLVAGPSRERLVGQLLGDSIGADPNGLGASVARRIVQLHGGVVELADNAEETAAIVVRLPHNRQAEVQATPTNEPRVLVVDDDPMVRRLLGAMLGQMGVASDTAEHGHEAVARLARTPDRYDGMLLDLAMPFLSGAETFQQVRRLAPNLPVIVCSGYAPAAIPDGGREFAAAIRKPFAARDLATALARAGVRVPSACAGE